MRFAGGPWQSKMRFAGGPILACEGHDRRALFSILRLSVELRLNKLLITIVCGVFFGCNQYWPGGFMVLRGVFLSRSIRRLNRQWF